MGAMATRACAVMLLAVCLAGGGGSGSSSWVQAAAVELAGLDLAAFSQHRAAYLRHLDSKRSTAAAARAPARGLGSLRGRRLAEGVEGVEGEDQQISQALGALNSLEASVSKAVNAPVDEATAAALSDDELAYNDPQLYWQFPPPAPAPPPSPPRSKAPALSADEERWAAAQTVLEQVSSHLEIKNDQRAPATSIDPSRPWAYMEATFEVREGRNITARCVSPDAIITDIINPIYGNAATGCNSTFSYSILAAACLDFQSCTLLADNAVFGDPCLGTTKSLRFTYRCGQPAAPEVPDSNVVGPPPSPPPPFPPFPPPPSPPPPSPPPPPPETQSPANPQEVPEPLPTPLPSPIPPPDLAAGVHFPPLAFPEVPAATSFFPGCLDTGSIRAFGAAGDGVTNDAPAIRRANASPEPAFLYFPVGVYRIRGNTTISKPIIMGANTRFLIDPGVLLIVTVQPRRAPIRNDAMFAGAGRVRFTTPGLEIYHEWWHARDVSDSTALQLAISSCAVDCTIFHSRILHLERQVSLNPRIGFFATAQALIVADGAGTGEGLVLEPGVYRQPLSFTGIRSFQQFGLKIQPGCSNVDIQAGHVSKNMFGLVLAAGAGPSALRNITISHVSVSQDNRFTVVIYSADPTASLFSDVTVRINFELMGGMSNPTLPASGVVFRGYLPTLQNTQVIFQAVDPAQFLTITQYVIVSTQTPGPVSNFVFRSECWNGGFELPGALVDGSFRDSFFYILMAGETAGRVFAFSEDSSGNKLTMGMVASASWYATLSPTARSLERFYRGSPLAVPGLYVGFQTTSRWAPGEERVYYLHTYFAQSLELSVAARCVPFRSWNPGLVCTGVVPDPAPGFRNQVAIRLVNMSRRRIQPGFFHRFAVQLE